MKNPNLKLALVVIGLEDFDTVINYGRTTQETVDATRNMIEKTLPDVSTVPQDGDLTVIANIWIDFQEVMTQKYENVSKESLVKLIQNPILDCLKELNLASLI